MGDSWVAATIRINANLNLINSLKETVRQRLIIMMLNTILGIDLLTLNMESVDQFETNIMTSKSIKLLL